MNWQKVLAPFDNVAVFDRQTNFLFMTSSRQFCHVYQWLTANNSTTYYSVWQGRDDEALCISVRPCEYEHWTVHYRYICHIHYQARLWHGRTLLSDWEISPWMLTIPEVWRPRPRPRTHIKCSCNYQVYLMLVLTRSWFSTSTNLSLSFPDIFPSSTVL